MKRSYLFFLFIFISGQLFATAKLVFTNRYDNPISVRLKGWKRMKGLSYKEEKPRLVKPGSSVTWTTTKKPDIKQNVLYVYDKKNKPYDILAIVPNAKDVSVSSGYRRIITFEDKDFYQDVTEKSGKTVSSIFRFGVDLLEKTRETGLDVLHTALAPARKILRNKKGTVVYDIIHKNPYAKKDATIRIGGPIACDQERKAFNIRQKKVKIAQEKFLDMKFNKDEPPLVVAFVGSGGGQRARLCTTGSCFAAEQTGLLDCVTYFSALSGSTWFLAPWLLTGGTVESMRERVIRDAMKNLGLRNSKKDIKDIINSLSAKFAFGQSINIIDLYGSLLGAYYLYGYGKDGNPQRTYLSDIASRIETGDYPLPIMTAVTAEIGLKHEWCFFTPWEFGSRWFGRSGMYIPMWAFGRKFKNKKTKNWNTDKDPLYGVRSTLPFLMAIWGSAMAAHLKVVYEAVLKDMVSGPIKAALRYALKKTDFGKLRLAWGEVWNPMYKLEESKYAKYRYLKLADAGIKMGCPVFDTYRRPADKNIKESSAPDVIFIFDASGIVGKSELERQEKYARKRNLPYPRISSLRQDVVHIFTKNPDPKMFKDYEIPTVIYLPRQNREKLVDEIISKAKTDPDLAYLGKLAKKLKDFDLQKCMKGSCGTLNFKHLSKMGKLHTSEHLVNMTEFNLRANIDKIKEVMKERIELKRKFRNKEK